MNVLHRLPEPSSFPLPLMTKGLGMCAGNIFGGKFEIARESKAAVVSIERAHPGLRVHYKMQVDFEAWREDSFVLNPLEAARFFKLKRAVVNAKPTMINGVQYEDHLPGKAYLHNGMLGLGTEPGVAVWIELDYKVRSHVASLIPHAL